MFKWYAKDPRSNEGYKFRHPERVWVQANEQVFIDERVVSRIDIESILDEVHRLTASHAQPITRIEVIPHQWVLDSNFASVAMICEVEGGEPLHTYYSIKRKPPVIQKDDLSPFAGFVEW